MALSMAGAVWGFLSLKAAPDFLRSRDPSVWVLRANLHSIQAKLLEHTCLQGGSGGCLSQKRECRGSSSPVSSAGALALSCRVLPKFPLALTKPW